MSRRIKTTVLVLCAAALFACGTAGSDTVVIRVMRKLQFPHKSNGYRGFVVTALLDAGDASRVFGLLPGDTIVQVNHEPLDDMTRDELLDSAAPLTVTSYTVITATGVPTIYREGSAPPAARQAALPHAIGDG